jgi:hypothetical protein
LTEQAVVIITVAVILLAMVFSFSLAGSNNKRTKCTSWKNRSNGIFEAHTDAGAIRFRRRDIEFVEPSFDEGNAHVSVRVGNLQRMVWIDFPDKEQALQFISLMERKFFTRSLSGMQDLF